jgi:ATP-dependent protease ClpP protease subunit
MSTPNPLPQTVYASFSGTIDQVSLSRIFGSMSYATQHGARALHLLFQSGGGQVDDSVALYNYLHAFPIELHFYNSGAVQSGATLAWIGVQHRHVSSHGRFMLHKSQNPGGGNAARIQSIADSLVADDLRIETIIKAHTRIPPEKWAIYETLDLTFNSQEAVQFGIADDIREFVVPAGNQIFNI